MGDIIFIFFFHNMFLFCIMFWLLTWMSEYFFKKKNHMSKKQLYECGFQNLSDLNIQVNINFSMMCIFLILYDVEFILLFPLFFNLFYMNLLSLFLFFYFYYMMIFSLYYDYQFNSLNWQY